DDAPETATGDGRPSATAIESTGSLSTLLAEPASATVQAHAYAPSTADTLTDARAEVAAVAGKMPVLGGAARSLAQLQMVLLVGEDARLRKRKGEEQDSPRTKRRKMIHADDCCPPSPHYVPVPVAIATPKSRRQLAFAAPSSVFPDTPVALPPASKAASFTS
ncbi:hypothetical protein IWQ56_002657, partial [Coemansia nantahalensis]